MCLVLIAHQMRADYPLLVLANRDEFFVRPTAPLSPWPEAPGMLAGRDLQAGGTWMGVRGKRWAAVTNIREGLADRADKRSRGWLVRDYLLGNLPPQEFLAELVNQAEAFAGFNLLLGEHADLWYLSNRGAGPRILAPGLYGLSNHLLETPWPKVLRGKQALQAWLAEPSVGLETALDLMVDPTRATDADLPDTGVPLAWERALSAIFIRTEDYGTRSTTLLAHLPEGGGELIERVYQPDPRHYRQQRFAWH